MTSGGSRDEFVVVRPQRRSSPRLREDLRILREEQPGFLREQAQDRRVPRPIRENSIPFDQGAHRQGPDLRSRKPRARGGKNHQGVSHRAGAFRKDQVRSG